MFTRDNLEQLTEIKAGQTGTGLLIENDGHIVGQSDTIMQIKEDIAHSDKFVIPDDFVVSAVFQKFGIKNANGRIYPENILKREVQKYLENQVKNRCAVGALDHPSSSSLSGHDVTHNILDLRWEGRTLIGEMKLHLSEQITLMTFQLLVLVEQRLGVLYVGDDLELIGWDVVMEPSTPNAWISTNAEELSQFIESDGTKTGHQINEKLSKINKILVG